MVRQEPAGQSQQELIKEWGGRMGARILGQEELENFCLDR
jgi:hypothetical protein